MILRVMFSRRWLLTTLLVLMGSLLCVRLGFWQLDRLAQRRAFNAHVSAMRALPPLRLPSSEDVMQMEWRAVQAEGGYDFEHQVAIRNQYREGQYGYRLLTPLRLADGKAVLVDRGWIPTEGNARPSDWRKYDQEGMVTVSGIVRLPQRQVTPLGASDPPLGPGQTRLDFWVYVDLDRIGAQIPYPLLPVYIQLDADAAQTTPPIPGQPALELSEGPHLGYAIQWFTFAALLVLGYPFYLRKQEAEA